jgi:tetratricopeptide (TPR) repeat protein
VAGKARDLRFFSQYLAGRLQLARGHARAAIEALEGSAELNEQYLTTLTLLGEAYACLGQDSKSAEAFLEASRLSPDDPALYRKAFDRYAAMGQWDPAREIATKVLESQGDSVPGRCMMVELLAATGQREEAARLLRQLHQQAAEDSQVQFLSMRMEMDSARGLLSRRQFDLASARLGEIVAKAPDHTQAALALADLFARSGIDLQAAEAMGRLHTRQPAHSGITRAYAEALFRAGRDEQAVEVLEALLTENPEDIQARRLTLEVLEKLKRIGPAATLAEEWLGETKDANARNWYRMRLLGFLEQAEDYPGAQRLLDEWLAENTDAALRVSLRTSKVQLYVRARQYEQAVEYCLQWIAQSPADNPVPRYRLIAALAEGKLYDKAQDYLAKWVEGDGGNAQAFRETAIDLYGQAGQIESAESAAQSWLKQAPWALPPRRALIGVLVRAEQYDKALALLDGWPVELQAVLSSLAQSAPAAPRTTRPAPRPATQPATASQPQTSRVQATGPAAATSSAQAGSSAATSRSATSRTASTTTSGPAESLRRMEAQGTIAWCRRTALELLRKQQKCQQALDLARRYAAAEPNEPEYLNTQATCLMELGRTDEAIAVLEAAVAALPAESGLKNNLGYNYAEKGINLPKAEQLVREALSSSPEEPAYMDSLGWVFYKQGRLSETAAVFEQMLQLGRREGPGFALMYDHAGDALYRLGWTDKALARWTKALDLAQAEKIANLETRQILHLTPRKIEAVKAGATPAIAPLGQGVTPPGEE